jgi:hypothetical protein
VTLLNLDDKGRSHVPLFPGQQIRPVISRFTGGQGIGLLARKDRYKDSDLVVGCADSLTPYGGSFLLRVQSCDFARGGLVLRNRVPG